MKGRVKLPYRARNPKAFEEVAEVLLREGGDCRGYTLDCSSWESVSVEYVEKRVYDRLSGLRLRLRIPVLVFRGEGGECRVEARWDGEFFTIDCKALGACCGRGVTRGP